MISLLDQLTFNAGPGPSYEAEDDTGEPATGAPVRLIAYYLPQFHPVPENDLWWGKGFTEWRNVTKGLPRYVGQLQPRLPERLGFYDLRLKDILVQQAALAKQYGIFGFCFHYYWFGGTKLLDGPINLLLADRSIDLPFCICWANENWTRTWSGQERSVLMAQTYSDAGDLAFAEDIKPLVSDPRYIKVNGRPLIMLYRPHQLPDAAATVARWREAFARSGLPDPYIIMPQAYGTEDPRPYGLDAAAGFPPHKVGFELPNLRAELELLDPRFLGRVCDYDAMVTAALALNPTEYKLLPGVCPSWDNEARRPGRGVSFRGATPAKFGQWLTAAGRKAMLQPEPDERIVFINAWNEWAEGACLEPDCHHGHAFLGEAKRALARMANPSAEPGMVVPGPAPAGKPTILSGRTAQRIRWKGAALFEQLSELIRP